MRKNIPMVPHYPHGQHIKFLLIIEARQTQYSKNSRVCPTADSSSQAQQGPVNILDYIICFT